MTPSRQALRRLAELPPLARQSNALACKVCAAASALFDVVDFNKFCSSGNAHVFGVAGVPVCYFRCDACELIFSDLIDDWSHEEISKQLQISRLTVKTHIHNALKVIRSHVGKVSGLFMLLCAHLFK